MRYLLGILVGAALALAVYLGLFVLSLGKPASEGTVLLLAKYRFKESIANKLPSPRIMIVSGSNGLYGISARMIEDTTGVPTVNFATQVQVSLDYLLEKAKQNARPGDVLILPLEYEFYFRKDETTEVFSDYVLGGDPAYFQKLPRRDKFWIIASASFVDICRRIFLGAENLRAVDRTVASMGVHMNDRGDLTEHLKSAQTPADRAEVIATKPRTVAFKWKRMSREEYWDQVAAFSNWCRAHDVLCLFTFPSTIHFKAYDRAEAHETVDKILEAYADRNVGVLGTPYDFMMPAEDFHNSGYHLNLEASMVRTRRLIELLQPILNDWLERHSPDH